VAPRVRLRPREMPDLRGSDAVLECRDLVEVVELLLMSGVPWLARPRALAANALEAFTGLSNVPTRDGVVGVELEHRDGRAVASVGGAWSFESRLVLSTFGGNGNSG
jgi:hypothetical protein